MLNLSTLQPVDYLVIGHLTCDIVPGGFRLGGAAAYVSRTARAMGLRVGIVTAWGNEFPLDIPDGIQIVSAPAEHSTTYENIYTDQGRIQYIHHQAPRIDLSTVPEVWRRAPIIHLGPIAQEVDAVLPDDFRPSLLGLTPQGWMRTWGDDRRVRHCDWKDADTALPKAGAVCISIEDIGYDENVIEHYMLSTPVLALTEGRDGMRLYWNHDMRRFRAPKVKVVEATGAGDVFAASFFIRLYQTRDPWEAARFAVRMSAISVTRVGLEGVPTPNEVQDCLMEVYK
jgi:sugar/nucleoside kinase (ribokinase family)